MRNPGDCQKYLYFRGYFFPPVLPGGCPACNRSALQESIDCLVDQYESYDFKVNGTFTLLENTADTGGLAVAYQVLESPQSPSLTTQLSCRIRRLLCHIPVLPATPAADFVHTCASAACALRVLSYSRQQRSVLTNLCSHPRYFHLRPLLPIPISGVGFFLLSRLRHAYKSTLVITCLCCT